MKFRRSATLAVALFSASLPSALSAQGGELHVPVILSLTGTAAFIGKNEQQDLQLIAAMVNNAGGIAGRRVVFDVADDQSQTQTAVELTNQLLAHKPGLVLGPTLTQDCNAIAPLVQKEGPVAWCFSPAIAPQPGGYVFSSSVSLRDCVVAQLRYFRERGWRRVAILSSTDATGQAFDAALAFAKALPENQGLDYVAFEHFNLNDVSVSAQIARLKAANPQAVFTWTVGPAFGTELRGIADAGLDVPVAASNGDMIHGQLAQYKSFIPKDLLFAAVLASAHDDLGNAQIKAAQSAYFDAFKAAGVKPDFPSTLAWDPVLLLLDGYRKFGPNATVAQFKAYLDGLRGWIGINGAYDFRDGNRRGLGGDAVIISRYDPAQEDFAMVSGRGGRLK